MNLIYTKEQLNFTKFTVRFKYKAASQQLLDKGKRMRIKRHHTTNGKQKLGD